MSEPFSVDYFDASALVKRYIEEAESDLVRRLLSGGLVATSRITAAQGEGIEIAK